MVRSRMQTFAYAGVFSIVAGMGIAAAQSSAAPSGAQQDSSREGRRAQGAAQPADDHQFVTHAAMANMAEVQLGHLATEKAQSAEVKAFGQRMIDDHLKAQKGLADAAAGAGVKWPTQLDGKHQQLRQRLSGLKGDQFDREYMKAMADGHREVEAMLAARANQGGRGEAAGAANGGEDVTLGARVTDWAARTLPDVRAHLKQAEQVVSGLASAK